MVSNWHRKLNCLLLLHHLDRNTVLQTDAGFVEDARGSLEVNSSLDSALQDDECETVKGFSADGHSYAGTVVRGVLRGDSK